MSQNEQTPRDKDVFSAYQENVDKLFSGIRHSVPQYHQSITNVQQEYLQAYENIVDSTITLQKNMQRKQALQLTFHKQPSK